MDILINCACGVELQAQDLTPAVAELLITNFDKQHPHNNARAKAGVTQWAETHIIQDGTEEK